jgi:AcrR family transcriptional regulator
MMSGDMINMVKKNDVAAVMAPEQSGEKTTKERIFEVALDLFAQKGFDAVSMREIAQAVGIKKASLYSHFSGKDELLEQLFNYPLVRLTNIVPYSQDTEQMIVSMGAEGFMTMASDVFNQWIATPEMEKIWRLICIELYHNERMKKFYKDFTGRIFDYWRSNFAVMMKHGLIKPSDPEVLAMEYLSSYNAAFMDYFLVDYGASGSFLEAEGKRLDDHVTFLVDSIKA